MQKIVSTLVMMMALSGTVEAAGEPLREFGVSKVNVLELGLKNDGSEDISETVNRYTEKVALYFPAGTYKVAKPLVLKNPICGDGYARVPDAKTGRTWLVSAIQTDKAEVGVINFGGNVRVSVTDLNISCCSQECGIRIAGCRQATATFIDHVGIFNMRSYGLYIDGSGSRPIFAQNMTIFSSYDWPTPCTAIYNGPGVCDNRFVNIEMMGVRVGMDVRAAYTYASNLHIWTGCMPGRDNGTWWRGTRGIVLHGGAYFLGSQIYPDSCFYALEQRGPNASFDLQNIMYWEDGSLKGSPDYDGEFFHCSEPGKGTLKIIGGAIGVIGTDKANGHMKKVYTPNQHIEGVVVRSDYAIRGENIDRLCFSGRLPDYTFRYGEKGYCKAADIFTVAKTGACEGVLTLESGAAFKVTVVKGADGAVEKTAQPLNRLCDGIEVRLTEDSGMVRVYVRNDGGELSGRFVTSYMGAYFRPLDYSLLRWRGGGERGLEVRAELP